VYRCLTYTDPFGLCKKEDADCHQVVELLRNAAKGATTKEAAANLTLAANIFRATRKEVEWVQPGHRALDAGGGIVALGATTRTHVYLNSTMRSGDRAVTAAHEATYHMRSPIPLPDTRAVLDRYLVDKRVYHGLAPAMRNSAALSRERLYGY
jgi:hypothetical protein